MTERFFYTIHRPYQYSPGPQIIRWDEIDYIASLERARELAIENRVKSYGEDAVDTTYGVEYDFTD